MKQSYRHYLNNLVLKDKVNTVAIFTGKIRVIWLYQYKISNTHSMVCYEMVCYDLIIINIWNT